MDKIFCLKHKDRDVAVISIDETGSITRIADRAERDLLPFGTGGDRNRLKMWWKHRAVPISQGNIREFLSREGISSAQIYLTRNLGLSMTDCYWVRPIESDLTWEKVNLYTNDFSCGHTCAGNNPWDRPAEGGSEPYGFTPDSSVQGELKKKWIVENGNRYLVKGNYGSSYQQSLNEISASLIHEKQSWDNYTPYSLCRLKVKLDRKEPAGALGCFSKAFTNVDLEFISGYEVCSSRKKDNAVSEYENFIRICAENGLDQDEVRSFLEYQILTDFVITNTDRHFNNFGILRNSNTMQFVKMAPIFDSGNSMFWRSDTLEIPYEKKDFRRIEVISFRRHETDLLKYVKDRRLLKIECLPGRNELERIYAADVSGHEGRYQKILEAYEKKIDLLDEFQRTGEISYGRKIINIPGGDKNGTDRIAERLKIREQER